MDYDMISDMTLEELKRYLRLQALRVTGRKQELVARVFSAVENEVQPVKSATEIEDEIGFEYSYKLKLDDAVIPDPYAITDGWIGEKDGMKFWPMVLYPDIFNYLMFFPSDLGSKDLNDYKNFKAYSYFKSGWLQPLFYHCLDTDSAKLTYLIKQNEEYVLSETHRYYTHCLVQMAVTDLEHSYFMIWTPHGFVIDHIDFDGNKWFLLKLELVSYYQKYYLKTIFNED